MQKCNCKKTVCDTNQCACFKAGRRCGSRCHPANALCRNHDACAGDAIPIADLDIAEEELSDDDPDGLGDSAQESD